jgi:hypothetical protein
MPETLKCLKQFSVYFKDAPQFAFFLTVEMQIAVYFPANFFQLRFYSSIAKFFKIGDGIFYAKE